jgi:hypothetical protein
MISRAKVKQLQKKEGADEGTMYIGSSMNQYNGMPRNALMRSNSLGHGPGQYTALPADIKHAMRMGMNGPLTPAASPSRAGSIVFSEYLSDENSHQSSLH